MHITKLLDPVKILILTIITSLIIFAAISNIIDNRVNIRRCTATPITETIHVVEGVTESIKYKYELRCKDSLNKTDIIYSIHKLSIGQPYAIEYKQKIIDEYTDLLDFLQLTFFIITVAATVVIVIGLLFALL